MGSFRTVLTYLFLFILTSNLSAQQFEVSKTTIRYDEEFKITLKIPKEFRKEFKNFLFPEIQDFTKIKTSFEEDKSTKTYIISQTYAPLRSGKFKVNPFNVSIGEKKIPFTGANVTVLSGSKKRKTLPEWEKANFKQGKQEIFLRVSADKNSIYAGEGFTISAFILIGDENETGFNFFDLHTQLVKIARTLSTDHCLIDENSKGIIEQLQFDTVKVKNKIYRRLKLFEAKAYPVTSEDLEFPSIDFKLLKYLTSKDQNEILWKSEELNLSTKPLKIVVKDLPPHPLKDQVSVGSFYFKEHISSGKVRTGHSFRYTFKISGTGNLSTVLGPSAQSNENFDFYIPETAEQYPIRERMKYPDKVFTYTAIPKEPGVYSLADHFQWVFFDPEKNRYDTLKSRIRLTVIGESQKNKEISSTDLGSFYELAGKESNQLRSKEKDQSIKFFANIIILFMLVTTAILIFRR